VTDTSRKPFVIHSDSKITLGPEARELCRFHGMSEKEMAQHLLRQHKLQQAGLVQKEGEG
jgi:hypothetical protein